MKKIHKFLLIMTLIIFPLFVFGCKNNTNEDTGLNVKSSDGDSFPPPIVVHYKTEKRYLNIGEDLKISVSFGRYNDYGSNLKSSTAELIMRRLNTDEHYTNYDGVYNQSLKIIDDFSSDEYKGTFTSDENVLNVTIPSDWFDNSWDCLVFSLMITEVFSTNGTEHTLDGGGVGAPLYYKIIGDQIKLYGSFYEFKNDK